MKHMMTVTEYKGEKREYIPFYLSQRMYLQFKKMEDDIEPLLKGFEFTITCVKNKDKKRWKFSTHS